MEEKEKQATSHQRLEIKSGSYKQLFDNSVHLTNQRKRSDSSLQRSVKHSEGEVPEATRIWSLKKKQLSRVQSTENYEI